MRKLIPLGILLTTISACTVGPDYVRPTIDTPESWTVSYSAATDMTDSLWWEKFDDPVLNELISSALANNLDLKAAVARVDQYLGQLRTTRSEFFPQIGATGGISRQDGGNNDISDLGAYSSYQGALNVSWEADIWGRVQRASEAMQAELLASEAGRRGVLLTLVSSVASNYLVLRGLDRQLEIAEETEQNYARSLKIFRQRHTYGTVSQIEVSQVESEYEDARQTIPEIETQIAQQEHLMSVLLGKNPGSIPRGKSIDDLNPPAIPAGLPAKLLGQRPDIIQAEQALIAANARIGVAEALYYPTISITGSLGVSTIHSDQIFDSDSGAWDIGGNVLAPIFTFGAIEGQVMASEAAQREAVYGYQQSIISAFRDVEDALVATTKGRERQASQGRRTAALATYSRLATYQYEAGTTDYLRVLDANRSLFSSQLDYVQTQTGVLTSLVDVYRSMGGGWVGAVDQSTNR